MNLALKVFKKKYLQAEKAQNNQHKIGYFTIAKPVVFYYNWHCRELSQSWQILIRTNKN